MKLRNLRVERQPKLMIIPMIDIIFFLLVFFMISTLYMTEQKSIPLDFSQAAAAQADLARQVNIMVTMQGKVFVDKEEVALPLLSARIEAELARSTNTTFIIRADKQVAYGEVAAVLEKLKHTGIKRIAIAAEAK